MLCVFTCFDCVSCSNYYVISIDFDSDTYPFWHYLSQIWVASEKCRIDRDVGGQQQQSLLRLRKHRQVHGGDHLWPRVTYRGHNRFPGPSTNERDGRDGRRKRRRRREFAASSRRKEVMLSVAAVHPAQAPIDRPLLLSNGGHSSTAHRSPDQIPLPSPVLISLG